MTYKLYLLWIALGLVDLMPICLGIGDEVTSEGTENHSIKSDELSLENEKLLAECSQRIDEAEYDDAIDCYTEAIERKPSKASYYGLRGSCFLEMEDIDAALSDYKKAISLMTDSGREELDYLALARLGRQLCRKKKLFDEAMWCFAEAIARDPHEASHFKMRADCHLVMKNKDMAIDDYKNAVQRNPRNDLYRLRLSELLRDVGRYTEAVNEILLSDDDSKILLICGTILFKTNEAIRCFTTAIEKSPECAAHYRSRAKGYLDSSSIHPVAEPENAIADMRKALQIDPRDTDTLYSLITVLLDIQKVDEAIAETRLLSDEELVNLAQRITTGRNAIILSTEAIRRNPSNASYYALRAQSFEKLKNWEKAIPDLKEASRLEPNNKVFRIRLTNVLMLAERYDEATKEMVHLNAGDFTELCYAFCEIFKNTLKQAYFCYNEAIKKQPKFLNLYKGRALTNWKLKRFEEAISDYQMILQEAYNSIYQMEFCELLLDAGKYSEAKTAIERLMKESNELQRRYIDSKRLEDIRMKLKAIRPRTG